MSKLGVLVSLETNQKDDKVNLFGKQLSMHIAASNPLALESALIDKTIIDKEQELITEELKVWKKTQLLKVDPAFQR